LLSDEKSRLFEIAKNMADILNETTSQSSVRAFAAIAKRPHRRYKTA
jgi:hypothetical protein